MIEFDFSGSDAFLEPHVRGGLENRATAAQNALLQGSGAGNEWLGWRRILGSPNDALLEEIVSVGSEIRERADVLVCIGIGGSYLGAEAVIRALSPYFGPPDSAARSENEEPGTHAPEILFAGHHLSSLYLEQLFESLEGRSVYVNVISKSGTTLEPAITFRLFRKWMEARFEDCDRRIIVTTDPVSGSLRQLSTEKGYRTFNIPADIGGRFSVMTPVGLLPITTAGFDIRSLFYGAVSMMTRLESAENNPSIDYAMRRYALHESGFTTEIFSVFEPRLSGLGAWWQQLFGESEGKDLKGLFPTVCTFSTDLHSLGQYIQSGRRNLLETFLISARDRPRTEIPSDSYRLDGLDFVTGKSMNEVARAAFEGTVSAHTSGGVPVHRITMEDTNEECLGELIYFFQHAVSIGGYLLGVNPFDQPGVENYKKEMLERLTKS